MAQDINLNNKVFNKTEYKKVINTNFTQLGVKTIQEQLDEQPTVQEFFDLYNQLFYDINVLGETNSHEFLVKTSGDYIESDNINEEIKALQEEIAGLREDLLEAQKENAELASTLPSS